jgi:hypothetical protein
MPTHLLLIGLRVDYPQAAAAATAASAAAVDSDRLAGQQQCVAPGKSPSEIHLNIVAHPVVHSTSRAPLQAMDAEDPAIDEHLLAQEVLRHTVVLLWHAVCPPKLVVT